MPAQGPGTPAAPPPTASAYGWPVRSLLAIAVLTVALGAFLWSAPLGEYGNAAVSESALVVSSLAVAVAAAWRSRRAAEPWPWRLLALGGAAFTLAEGYWLVAELVLHREVPLASTADVLYYLGYAGFLAALVAFFPGRSSWRDRWRRLFDVIALGATLGAIGWILFLHDVADASATTHLGALVTVSYPALDLALAALLLVLASELQGVHRHRILLLGAGAALWFLGDSAYAYLAVQGDYLSGFPFDVSWVAGDLLLALAPLVGPPGGVETPRPRTGVSRPSALLLYIPILVLLPVAVFDYARTGRFGGILFGLGVTLVAAFTARQFLLATDLLELNRRLGDRERSLREAQAVGHVGSWEVDLGTNRVQWSDETWRLLGLEPGSIVPSREAFLERVHPEDRARVQGLIETAVAAGRNHEFECRIVRPNGEVRWTFHRNEVVLDEGRPVRIHGINQDTTERKIDEADLQRTRARLAGILDSQDALIVRVDPKNRITYMNGAYERTFGLKVGDTFWVKVHPDDEAKTQAALEQLKAPPYRCAVEQRCDIRGEWRWVFWQDSVVRDAAGNVAEIQGVGFDITDRKKAEEELEKREARFRILVENSPDIIVRHDRECRRLYANPTLARIAGRPAEELLGKRPSDGPPPPATAALMESAIKEVFRTGLPRNLEVPWMVSGEPRIYNMFYVPERARDGSVTAVLAVGRDITETLESRKRAEEARRLAETAAFKSRFLNAAAHELANPLTPLKLELATLRSGALGDLSERQRDALDLLDRNIGRLSLMVQDLLDAARLDSGRLRLAPAPVDLQTLVQDGVASFASQADAAGVRLRAASEGPLPVVADVARLSQVLFNLVHNALKFTPRGGRVEVAYGRREGEAWMSVRDTGLGLTPDQMARLFTPFTQVHDIAHAPNGGGTGLGLYISQGIMQEHGGRITVESPGPGQGATFTVWLPLQPRPATAAA